MKRDTAVNVNNMANSFQILKKMNIKFLKI